MSISDKPHIKSIKRMIKRLHKINFKLEKVKEAAFHRYSIV